jgi:hypothetical protein
MTNEEAKSSVKNEAMSYKSVEQRQKEFEPILILS